MPKPKVITPVSTEPITLAELKRHLRIYDDGYNDTQSETITTRYAGPGTITGDSVDVLGASATMFVNVGAIASGGKLDVAIHHSDDNVTFTAWSSGTFTQISAIGQASKLYTGGKRYIKAIATVSTNNVTFGVNVQIIAGDPTDDTELSNMITRAREQGEEYCRLAFAPQTLEQHLDVFPDKNFINVSMPPLTSVTSVKILSSTGVETTLAVTTQYLVDTDSTPGRILLPYGGTWPSGADYPVNPIRIRYVAGYTTLPQALKNILLYHCGLLYKYRDVAMPENEYKSLLRMYDFYRVSWFGGGE
jgi:uncharacterized phiE125 gp8 family phage protein